MPLQDTDNLIIGRGTDSYKITYQDLKDDLNYVPPPTGTINKPVVLSPEDGAGSGTTRDIETDTITKVENDGANKKLTLASNKDLADLNPGDVVRQNAAYQPVSDSIVSVTSQFDGSILLTLSGATDLDYFRVGDVVQDGDITGDWSSMLTGGSFGDRAYNAFDGDLTTYHTADIGGTAVFTPVYNGIQGIPVKNQVEFQLLAFRSTTNPSFKVNRVEYGPIIGTAGSNVTGPISFVIDDISTLGEVSWQTINGSNSIGVYAIIVDGVTLIDSNVADSRVRITGIDETVPSITVNGGDWDPTGVTGDAEVTCLSPLKAPTNWTVEGIDTTANTLTLSHAAEDSSQVWVANDNQAGTDFFVTGPQVVDAPLLTADITLRSSDFATTPPDAGNFTNAQWYIRKLLGNGPSPTTQTLDAGPTFTFKPPAGTFDPNSQYAVAVTYQSDTLDDSDQSDSVTFTTGATRNMYEYHRSALETIRANFEARVAALEADHMTLMNNNNNNYGY